MRRILANMLLAVKLFDPWKWVFRDEETERHKFHRGLARSLAGLGKSPKAAAPSSTRRTVALWLLCFEVRRVAPR